MIAVSSNIALGPGSRMAPSITLTCGALKIKPVTQKESMIGKIFGTSSRILVAITAEMNQH